MWQRMLNFVNLLPFAQYKPFSLGASRWLLKRPQLRHMSFGAVCGGIRGDRKTCAIAMDTSVSEAMKRADLALVGGLEATAAGIPNSGFSFRQSLQLTWVLLVNYLPELRDPSAMSKEVHELLLSI